MAQGRSLWGQVLKNFLDSLKPRSMWGDLKGKDYLGTEYYEAPRTLKGSRPSRWFVPEDPNNFEQELPPEWQAWLRHNRKEPPTDEEIQLNLQKMYTTIENAKNLELSHSEKPKETVSINKPKFPSYKEYDVLTGFSKESKEK